jgi:hypothetical protein
MAKTAGSYGGKSAVCLAIAAVVWFLNKDSPCEPQYACITIGQPYWLTFTDLDESVSGLAQLNGGRATIELDGGQSPIVLEVYPFLNDTLTDGIDNFGLTIKGISVTDIHDPMKVHSAIDVPNDTNLLAATGSIAYSLDVTYPQLVDGDNVIIRSACALPLGELTEGCMRWEAVNQVFERIYPAKMVARGATDLALPPIAMWLPLLVGGWYVVRAVNLVGQEPYPPAPRKKRGEHR